MDFKTIIDSMLPYWILGTVVILTTIFSGNKDLVRVDKKAVAKWGMLLCLITVYRVILSKLLPDFHGIGNSAKNIAFLPWGVAFTVFWEDACHGLPLLLLKKLLPKNKLNSAIYAAILGLVMFEFGTGHLYQGVMPAVLLSFYIPYSVKIGEKYGFGTVMICHMLYDLVTILFTRYLFGM